MSIINEYLEIEENMKRLKERAALLEGNEELKKEFEFKDKLVALLSENGKSLRDVILLLDPDSRTRSLDAYVKAASKQPRRSRRVKEYTNPHTGETLQTKGGNHKELKAWKEHYGADEVEGWSKILG